MDDLIDKIETAFADVDYPGDDDLTNSKYGEEPAVLRDEFRGKSDRSKLDSDFLNYAPDNWGPGTALSFFSDDALRFYLPLYLIADIQGELWGGDPSWRLCMSVKGRGKRDKSGNMIWSSRDTFDKFDGAQASAVVDYLRWKMNTEDGNKDAIEEALENYWLQRGAENRH